MWLIRNMRVVGIFEAKTKFTALCEEVVRTGMPTLVQKRGRPLVVVTPVPSAIGAPRGDILQEWGHWEANHPQERGDFPEVWKMRGEVSQNPLED
jgi:prevent-host-death family protein